MTITTSCEFEKKKLRGRDWVFDWNGGPKGISSCFQVFRYGELSHKIKWKEVFLNCVSNSGTKWCHG